MQLTHTPIHDCIIAEVLKFSVKIRLNEYDWRKEMQYLDAESRTIIVDVLSDESYFWSACYLSFYELANCLGVHYYSDITTRTQGGYILGDYDMRTNNDGSEYPKGWCNVISFTTVSNSGVVRHSQIAYSHRFNRLVLRDDVCYQLPKKLTKEPYLGFTEYKRPQHRIHSTLFLRNTYDDLNLCNAFAVGCKPYIPKEKPITKCATHKHT